VIDTLRRLDRGLPFGTGTVLAATIGCLLAAGTATAIVKDDGTAKPAAVRQSPSPTPTASRTAAPTPTKAAPKVPADFLLDVESALTGWGRVNDRVAAAGPMDLEDAAEIEAGGEKVEQEDRDALIELGYVRGHSRAWTDGEATLVVFVYEWKGTNGPLTFVRGLEAINKETGTGWKPATPRSAGGCRPQGDQVNDSVVTAVGKHSFLVVVLRTGSCTTHEPVARIADLQAKFAATLGA